MDRLTTSIDRAFAHPRLLAPVLGALAACGFEPLRWWPLALLALAGLIELTGRAASARQAMLIGWLFGLGHFTLGNNWIAMAFTYQAAMPVWLGWIAVVLLAAYLAVFPALTAWAAWRLGRVNYAALVLCFAALWIVTEWLRGWLFTGFPWNPLAALLLGPADRVGAALLTRVVGTYGLSGLAMMLAGAWLIALKRRRIDWRGALLVGLPLALWFLPSPGPQQAGQGTRFTLVQPMIPQEQLNDPAYFPANYARLAAQSAPRAAGQRRLLLWPESGVPDYLRDGYPDRYYLDNYAADPVMARLRLGKLAGAGTMLLSGTTDLEIAGGRAVGARNAVTALDETGTIRGSYAKAHLVPYGEYVPLRRLLTPLGLARLVPGDIEFWPGPGQRTVDLGPWGKVGVQICYEIIFSGEVVDRANRPDFIFSPSNDGWYGAWGPPQFHAQARLRAVEEGLPVLRVTTTGISAAIDAHGRVLQSLPWHQAGRIDGTVPRADPPTLFARLGNMLPLGLAVFLLGLSLVARRRREG